MEKKRPQIASEILSKKIRSEVITISEFKMNVMIVVIKHPNTGTEAEM